MAAARRHVPALCTLPGTFRLIVKNITTTAPAERVKGQALVADIILAYQV